MGDAPFQLTQGERMMLLRRRRGETARAVAARLGITAPTVCHLEADTITKLRRGGLARGRVDRWIAFSVLVEPTAAEWAYVLRRRLGWTQEEACRRTGEQLWRLRRIESGRSDPVYYLHELSYIYRERVEQQETGK